MTSDRRTFIASLLLLGAAITVAPAACAKPEAPLRIVAVGDVHGSFEGLTAILQTTGITDAEQRWAGGTMTFVQTGDIFDRGPGVRQALDMVMRLQGEASQAGGRLEPLLGNHEVVNILGDLRDVPAEGFAAFADGQSEERRVRAYDDLVASATRRGQQASVPARDAWMTAHPPGFIEYNEAVGPRGVYGRWIRSHKVVVAINNTAFMHAGINHDFQGTLDDVNRIVADEIAAWDSTKDAMVRAELIPPFATMSETIAAATAELERLAKAGQAEASPAASTPPDWVERLKRVTAIETSPLLAENGPMWFRGFALWKETDEPPFTALLGRLGIGRFVAGHTPMPTRRIMNRWDYRVFQIDSGMLGGEAFKGGRASALEILGDRITAIYTDSREVVVAGGS